MKYIVLSAAFVLVLSSLTSSGFAQTATSTQAVKGIEKADGNPVAKAVDTNTATPVVANTQGAVANNPCQNTDRSKPSYSDLPCAGK